MPLDYMDVKYEILFHPQKLKTCSINVSYPLGDRWSITRNVPLIFQQFFHNVKEFWNFYSGEIKEVFTPTKWGKCPKIDVMVMSSRHQ